MVVGIFRVVPLPGETTCSLMVRIAARYGMEAKTLRSGWKWRNSAPTYDSGGQRADAEVLFNAAGRLLLADVCGVAPGVLARALAVLGTGRCQVLARREGRGWSGSSVAGRRGALVGPVAFGCRLCTARRTGASTAVVRYAPRWGAGVRAARAVAPGRGRRPAAGAPLDVRALPEVAASQRRCAGVARRAVRAGAGPERVFALSHAVVARWREQALRPGAEKIWPRRLHQVAGGDAGGDLERWPDRGTGHGRLPRGGGRGRRFAGPCDGRAGVGRQRGRAAAGAARRRVVLPQARGAGGARMAGAVGRDGPRRAAHRVDGQRHPPSAAALVAARV